jgi:hypothetical protein
LRRSSAYGDHHEPSHAGSPTEEREMRSSLVRPHDGRPCVTHRPARHGFSTRRPRSPRSLSVKSCRGLPYPTLALTLVRARSCRQKR